MNASILEKMIGTLKQKYRIIVRKERPFEVLIHGILSARTKDTVTHPAQERLFNVANNPEKIAKLSLEKIRKLIYPVNYYIGKAKKVKKVCQILVKKYRGTVPRTRGELMQLPGVRPKISDLVLLFGYGNPVIPVDTHVEIISKRWHIADKKAKPTLVREKLHELIPESERAIVNQPLVQFGKEICITPIPKCYKCPVEKLCPYENKNLKPKLEV